MKAENGDDEPASEAIYTVNLSAVSRMYVVDLKTWHHRRKGHRQSICY